jgi:polyhydroxybutyrate depolymerase
MGRHIITCVALALGLVWAASANAAGCGLGAPGTSQRVTIGATGRTMLIHVPKGYRGHAPLVFLLHGSGSKGADMLRDSHLAGTADRHGFLVAAPDGGIVHQQGFVWNIPGVPTVAGKIPGPEDADDVAYLGAAIDWLTTQGCADRARIYATGLSGGGRMTSWLGCVASRRFAAIAPVVGLRAGNPSVNFPQAPDPASCAPERPMPVMAFAGGKDSTNPIAGGGAGYWQYSMRTAEMRWADLNHCRIPLPERTLAKGIEERGYRNCRQGAEVLAHIDPEGGHNWNVVDNEALWAFFARHSRR